MEDLSFLPELPTGPLDVYRNNSSFNWKRLKLALEGDLELLKLKVRNFNTNLIPNHCRGVFYRESNINFTKAHFRQSGLVC